ncbi:MAG: energy transducer TonB [Gemmatimonadales bacterium]
MPVTARAVSILAIPASFLIGAVVLVGACGAPLPTSITDESPAPETDQGATRAVTLPPTQPRDLEPTFTPMTVRPVLTNAGDVQRTLLAEYPALLRDAGIGGTAIVWIHIPLSGAVDDARVFESSGFEALDQAALKVARAMVFQPAMNGDRVTDAWVQLPIRFAVVQS